MRCSEQHRQYGNMGCQVSKGGMQMANNLHTQKYYCILLIGVVPDSQKVQNCEFHSLSFVSKGSKSF
jgi:hypothetical protein